MPPVTPAIKNSGNVFVEKSNPVGLLPNRVSNFLWPIKDNLCKHRGYIAFCTKEPWYTCDQTRPSTKICKWRWLEYWPKHVGETNVTKMHHRILKAFCWLFIYFWIWLMQRKKERIKRITVIYSNQNNRLLFVMEKALNSLRCWNLFLNVCR